MILGEIPSFPTNLVDAGYHDPEIGLKSTKSASGGKKMPQHSVRDRYLNVAAIDNTMSAANVITYAPLTTNMGFLGRRDQALAMIIDEIQYSPQLGAIAEMTATGDYILMGLTTSDLPTDMTDLTDQRVLDFNMWVRHDLGTAASGVILQTPARKQFFPPMITAERTLFLGIATGGLASPARARIRILYRVETLTGAELVELSEVFRLTG